jgi:hypothetical protein
MGWEMLITHTNGHKVSWFFDLKDQFYDALNFSHRLLEHGYAITCRQIAEDEVRAAQARSGGINDASEFKHWAHQQRLNRHGS